jgi:molecular chaperone HscB
MPTEFLMQQMEWREALEDAKNAKDIDALENLLREMRLESDALKTELGMLIDNQHDYTAATAITRKLIFIDKVCADINKALEKLED